MSSRSTGENFARLTRFLSLGLKTHCFLSYVARMHATSCQRRTVSQLASAMCRGDRGALSRALTLVESKNRQNQKEASQLLSAVLPHRPAQSLRIGISGPPGTGKSTLIEALGGELVSRGHRLAVLAVDPSSQRSGGSIMGDKTRMPTLSVNQRAFIRPSPAQGVLGGVARRTSDSILCCECAG